MVSIVIPAYNEEAVIGRCLRSLLDGALPGELEIIVACNGCTDRTADAARAFAPAVRVIEVPVASKTAALNAGDALATAFPRFYIDADIVLPLESIRTIVSVMSDPTVLLASPVARTDTTGSSPVVRMFYDIWLSLPYNRFMVGTGVYVLSKIGRARFAEFPNLIADDGFVRSRFRTHERRSVADAPVYVTAPGTLRDLVTVKVRSRLGGYELSTRMPSVVPKEPASLRSIVSSLPHHPALPVMLLVYLGVTVVARVRARVRLRRMDSFRWDRDENSRRSADTLPGSVAH